MGSWLLYLLHSGYQFFVISEHEKSTPANYKLDLSLYFCFEILKILFFIFNLFVSFFNLIHLKVKCINRALTGLDF